MTIPPLQSGAASSEKVDSPAAIHKAATQFEALLLGQLLKMSHGEDSGWLGSGEDGASSSAMAMAEESLATSIAEQGGIGLSGLALLGLQKR